MQQKDMQALYGQGLMLVTFMRWRLDTNNTLCITFLYTAPCHSQISSNVSKISIFHHDTCMSVCAHVCVCILHEYVSMHILLGI